MARQTDPGAAGTPKDITQAKDRRPDVVLDKSHRAVRPNARPVPEEATRVDIFTWRATGTRARDLIYTAPQYSVQRNIQYLYRRRQPSLLYDPILQRVYVQRAG